MFADLVRLAGWAPCKFKGSVPHCNAHAPGRHCLPLVLFANLAEETGAPIPPTLHDALGPARNHIPQPTAGSRNATLDFGKTRPLQAEGKAKTCAVA